MLCQAARMVYDPHPSGFIQSGWALVYEKDGEEHLYFVVETKGVDSLFELPDEKQSRKILCGRKHFNECLANNPGTPARQPNL